MTEDQKEILFANVVERLATDYQTEPKTDLQKGKNMMIAGALKILMQEMDKLYGKPQEKS